MYRKLLFLIWIICATGCATWIANEQNEETSKIPDADERSSKREKDIGIAEAVLTDIELIKEAINVVSPEFKSNKNKGELNHSGEDTNLCSLPQKKVCTLNEGCECTN